ncbi:SRPBCC family protein [Nocardia inohanensis]|uniref:SRPBCC family protein n=1 Tax=Nocardia inohanensis TaxID=209246 RepID=UPI000831659B|nr:SRPBCC family protein [Nocardia inohanensis]
MLTTIIIIAAVLLVLGAIGAAIGALIARKWAGEVLAGKGFEVRPLTAANVDEFLEKDATFTVTVGREFPYPAHRVWDALQLDGMFSWIPLVNGVRYRDGDRRAGALRTLDGVLAAAEERVIAQDRNSRLTVTGTHISIPFLIRSFAEDYRLTETAGGTLLTWTIAARPRVGTFLPLHWAAPFARPFARLALKGLAARI